LASDIASTTYTATELTPGTYYEFKVESRNSYGYSVFSDVLTLLAAFKPEAPGAPTTTTINNYVEVSWPAAVDNGSPITQHRVYI
jgi:hypothetical protein